MISTGRRERGSARCQMQKISAGKFHVEPPLHHSITSSARASKLGGTSLVGPAGKLVQMVVELAGTFTPSSLMRAGIL